MKALKYTLISDGSSDRALLPILRWLLEQNGVTLPIQPSWAELRNLPKPPIRLEEKIARSIDLYPCDLLFIHRDAERESHQTRRQEIFDALLKAKPKSTSKPLSICVVPVRMQEAWLLFDQRALRIAAGNPNGQQGLNLPPLRNLEQEANPKLQLYNLLKTASGLSGRKLKQFNVSVSAYRVVEFINDFSPLRHLTAFSILEADIKSVIVEQGWDSQN